MIIGFSGPIHSGKSYGARLLKQEIEKFGKSCTTMSFATLLKKIAEIAGDITLDDNERIQKLAFIGFFIPSPYLGVAIEQMVEYGNLYPNITGEKNRRLLQSIGTECGRNILGETVWVDAALRIIENSKHEVHIFDDVRFNNEAAILDYHIQIKITRPTHYRLRLQDVGYEYVFSDHASERSLTQTPNIVIDNDFSQQTIRTIAENIILPHMV